MHGCRMIPSGLKYRHGQRKMHTVYVSNLVATIIDPLGGYLKVTHRVQGEIHVKFGWNPSSNLGSKSEQMNRQTDRPTRRANSFSGIIGMFF